MTFLVYCMFISAERNVEFFIKIEKAYKLKVIVLKPFLKLPVGINQNSSIFFLRFTFEKAFQFKKNQTRAGVYRNNCIFGGARGILLLKTDSSAIRYHINQLIYDTKKRIPIKI